MKKIRMMYLDGCPYCRQAFQMIEELKAEYSQFKDIAIEIIEERRHPEIADTLDYYFVPTYYVDGIKMHEGVPTKEKLHTVLETAIS